MEIDRRAIVAAHNNADLYEAMFASKRLGFERLPYAFVEKDPPPPYYSSLTSLLPDHANEIVEKIKAIPRQFGRTVVLKDSFCDLDTEPGKFDVL